MEKYSLSVGGLPLRIRKSPRGHSVASGATIQDEQTAQTMAEGFAAKMSGRAVENVEWKESTPAPEA